MSDHFTTLRSKGLRKCPGKVKELILFEKDLIVLVKNVKFRKVINYILRMLQQDIRIISGAALSWLSVLHDFV